MAHYRLFGRVCESSVPLPELLPAPGTGVDFTFEATQLGPDLPVIRDHVLTQDGEEWLAAAEHDETVWFRFLGRIVFRARLGRGQSIDVAVDAGAAAPGETVRHLFVDEVIPALLAMSGSSVLHGAAVALSSGALVLLGESGMGKSTLAAAFALAGVPVLSDDCVVIDPTPRGPMVQAGYPSLRVWRESAVHLFGTDAGGLPFAHYTEKRRYRDGLAFADVAAPLSGIVCLGDGPNDRIDHIQPCMLHGHAKSAAIVGGAKSMPLGPRKAAAVEVLLDLADQVPVARLSMPDDLEQVPRVRDALVEWAARR